MKATQLLRIVLAFGLTAGQAVAAIGYVNEIFHAGDTWFGNPLDAGNNSLNYIIPSPPGGTSVSLWNSASSAWTPSATFNSGSGWDNNLTLSPGTGALLIAPSEFTNTFVGAVLNFDGSPLSGPFTSPPPFAGPSGSYLLSSKCPAALPGLGFDVFQAVIGREPLNGEQFTTLNPVTQTFTTTTFVSGSWDNSDPSLAVGQAAMFNIIGVPEASSANILAVGLCLLAIIRRKDSRS